MIAGNHDLTFDEEFLCSPKVISFGISREGFKQSIAKFGATMTRQLLTNCTYLEDSSVSICGISIYGSPW